MIFPPKKTIEHPPPHPLSTPHTASKERKCIRRSMTNCPGSMCGPRPSSRQPDSRIRQQGHPSLLDDGRAGSFEGGGGGGKDCVILLSHCQSRSIFISGVVNNFLSGEKTGSGGNFSGILCAF